MTLLIVGLLVALRVAVVRLICAPLKVMSPSSKVMPAQFLVLTTVMTEALEVPFVPAEKTAVLALIQAAGLVVLPSEEALKKGLTSSQVPLTSPPPSLVAPVPLPLMSE